MNDFVNAFAKIASERMEALKVAFDNEMEKILQELADDINEAEAKQKESGSTSCPSENAEVCDRCACDENDEFQTVTLGDENFFDNDDPCEIVTIYISNRGEDPKVAVEYDKSMGANGAMVAFLCAFPHMMHHSMTSSGIDVALKDCVEAVASGFVGMAADAALKL